MKYIEALFYALAWFASFLEIDTNLTIGLIAVGLMWKCAGEMQ